MSRSGMRVIDELVSEPTGETSRELHDLVEGLEGMLEAYAAGVIDVPPALEQLLLDLLELVVASANDTFSPHARVAHG
jgi:hypothetical protein